MPYKDYSPEEVEARGEAIYEKEIRPKVERDHKGKFVVIDIETHDYEMDDDDLRATKRMMAKRPDAVLYGVRVGHPTAYSLGGHFTVEE